MQAPIAHRYYPVRVLGEGGFGRVVLARDALEGGRTIAVKILRPDLLQERDEVEAFRREFLTLADLSHPHLARVHEFGPINSSPGYYFTADYIPGQNICHASRSVRPKDVVGWTLQILHAVRYIHSRGFLHGDVKPSNVLITPVGACGATSVKLIDFGLAHRIGEVDRAGFAGTRPYLAPEVAARKAGASPGTDLYSLGVTLYQALTGSLPFADGASGPREVPPPSLLRPELGQAFDRLMERLTAVRPRDRFRSADDAIRWIEKTLPHHEPPSYRCPERMDFVGRDGEVEALVGLVADHSGGLPRRPVRVIRGPMGIGKSRLVAEAQFRIQVRGVPVARVQLGLGVCPMGSAARALGFEVTGDLGSRVAALRARLRDRPAVLVFEDFDRASEGEQVAVLRWIEGLRPGGAPVFITTRDPGGLPGMDGLPPNGEAIDLAPLPVEAVHQLARSHFGVERVPERVLRHIVRDSGGNPLWIGEVLRSMVDAGARPNILGGLEMPKTVNLGGHWRHPDVPYSGRIDGLGARARAVLEVVALSREPLHPDVIRAVQAHGPEAIRELEEKQLLAWIPGKGGPCYGLLHPLLREQVESAMSASRRRSIHLQLAAIALRLGADGWGQAFEHFRDAEMRGETVRWGSRAARRLLARGDLDRARDIYLGILPVLGRADRARDTAIRYRLASIAALAGNFSQGIEVLRPVLRAGKMSPKTRAAVRELLSRLHEKLGEAGRAEDEMRQAVAVARPERRAAWQARLALLCLHQGKEAAARRAVREAEASLSELAGPAGMHAERCRALAQIGSVCSMLGETQRAIACEERALELARSLGDRSLEATPLNELGIALGRANRFAEAMQVFEEAREVAEAAADRSRLLSVVLNLAVSSYKTRDLDRALGYYREALAVSEELGENSLLPAIWNGMGGIHRERGEIRDAIRFYRRVIRRGRGGRRGFVINALQNLGDLYQLLGYPAKALRARHSAMREAEGIGDHFLRCLTAFGMGIAEYHLGRWRKAEGLFHRALDLLSGGEDPRLRGSSHYFLGAMMMERGDVRRALREFGRCTRMCRRAEDPVYLYHGYLGLAEAQIDRGDPERGVRILQRADREVGDRIPPDLFLRGRVVALDLDSRRADPRRDLMEDAEELLNRVSSYPEVYLQLQAVRAEVACRRRDERLLGEALFAGLTTLRRMERAVPPRLRTPYRRRRLVGRFLEAAFTAWGASAELGDDPLDSLLRLLALETEGVPPGMVLRAVAAWLRRFGGASRVVIVGRDGERPRVIPPIQADDLDLLTASEVDQAIRGMGTAVKEGRSNRRVHPLRVGGETVGAVALEGSGEGLPPSRRALSEAALRIAALALSASRASIRTKRARSALGRALEEVEQISTSRREERDRLETEILSHRTEVLRTRGQLEEKQKELERQFGLEAIVGRSPAVVEILRALPEIASGDIPVLIVGESGTGKDLLARTIHYMSPRKECPFVGERCSAIPEGLLESELFGYVPGAFTDAVGENPGLFRRVGGGTLYLDEVTEAPAPIQLRLLRVLEEKRVRPLGAESAVSVDFRLVTSSRIPLERVEGCGFRRELLYRIKGIVIELPPLRDRPEDIPLIADAIIERLLRAEGRIYQRPAIDEDAVAVLQERPWPGNIRELENELRGLLLFRPDRITREMVLHAPREGKGGIHVPRALCEREGLRGVRERVEKELVEGTLSRLRGNVSQAARALGITRRYLGMLLKRYGLDPGTHRLSKKGRGRA